jgi:hypothetical protein
MSPVRIKWYGSHTTCYVVPSSHTVGRTLLFPVYRSPDHLRRLWGGGHVGRFISWGLTSRVPSKQGYGYIAARNDTTQQSGQTSDKEVEIKNITVYVSGYSETDTTGMLSAPTVWSQQS